MVIIAFRFWRIQILFFIDQFFFFWRIQLDVRLFGELFGSLYSGLCGRREVMGFLRIRVVGFTSHLLFYVALLYCCF